MKMLFLDFDGVLHPTSLEAGPLFSKASLLSMALYEVDLPIVISSSWRFTHSIKELKGKLPSEIAKKIIDVTGPAVMGKHPRYNEIINYLDTQKDVTDWRALDDSYWEFPSPCPQLIRCSSNTGINIREINVITDWLIKSQS
jgi:HAD domain in Swiss Army Knife RNA repair proteins